jgi:hypothetical protein
VWLPCAALQWIPKVWLPCIELLWCLPNHISQCLPCLPWRTSTKNRSFFKKSMLPRHISNNNCQVYIRKQTFDGSKRSQPCVFMCAPTNA